MTKHSLLVEFPLHSISWPSEAFEEFIDEFAVRWSMLHVALLTLSINVEMLSPDSSITVKFTLGVWLFIIVGIVERLNQGER